MAILWYRGITLSSVTWKIHLKKWSYTIPVPTYIGEKSPKSCMWQVPWWLIRGEDIYVHLSGGRRIMSTGFIIWELWYQKQVSRAWLSNYSPQDTVGCNYLAMPYIPAQQTEYCWLKIHSNALILHQSPSFCKINFLSATCFIMISSSYCVTSDDNVVKIITFLFID